MTAPVSSKFKDSSTPQFKQKLSSEEQLEKTRQGFFKIIGATLKAQSPDDPVKPGEMAQLHSAMEAASASLKSVGILEEIKNALSSHEMTKALPFHGKKVQYDTSTKNFDGKAPIEFQYQLKYSDNSRPSGAHVSTIVTILDSRGIRVHQARGKTDKGVHGFKWDGKDSKGKTLSEGEYRIKVESNWEQMQDGVLQKTPIEAGAFISGYVESVEMRGDKVNLIVDGASIDIDDVIKIEREKEEDSALKVADYASYIGQDAEVDDNELTVDKGIALINYKCDLERPGKLSVQIFDEDDKFVGVAVSSSARKGLNNIKLKVSDALSESEAEEFLKGGSSFKPLAPGKYRYKLFVQDLLTIEPERYVAVPTTRSITITGLDFEKEPFVVAGSEKFILDKIKKLSATSRSSDILKEAVQYLGKFAEISLNQLEVKNGATEAQFFRIPAMEANMHYGKAYLDIFDQAGRNVARVEKEAKALITIPEDYFYNLNNVFNFLTNESKPAICAEWVIDPPVNNMEEVRARIQAEHVLFFTQNVMEKVQEKELHLDYNAIFRNYDDLPESDQALVKNAIDANRPYTGFKWNGIGFDGKLVPNGPYRYEMRVEKYHTTPDRAEAALELELVPDRETVKIQEYTSEKGELKFIGKRIKEDGTLYGDNIAFATDEIVRLFA